MFQVFEASPSGYKYKLIFSGQEDAKLHGPQGIAIDHQGNYVVSDTTNQRIQVFTPEGVSLRKFVTSHTVPEDDKLIVLSFPIGVAINSLGHIVSSENGTSCIHVFDASGQSLKIFAGFGTRTGELASPMGLTLDREDNIIVADQGNARIQIFSRDGDFLMQVVLSPVEEAVEIPTAVALAPNGNILVSLENKIQIYG